MSTVGLIISIIAGLILIAGFVVSVWVTARERGKDERIKRLLADSNDYRERLEFVEPRLTKALEENGVLQGLLNPTAAISEIQTDTAAIKRDTAQILAVLRAQAVDLTEAMGRTKGEDQ